MLFPRCSYHLISIILNKRHSTSPVITQCPLSSQLVSLWGSDKIAYPFRCQTPALKSQAISTCSQLLVNKCSPRTQHLIGNTCISKFLFKLDFISLTGKTKPRFSWNYTQKLKTKNCVVVPSPAWVPLTPIVAVVINLALQGPVVVINPTLQGPVPSGTPLPWPLWFSVFCFTTKCHVKLRYTYRLEMLA